MKRRTFLKLAAAGAASLALPPLQARASTTQRAMFFGYDIEGADFTPTRDFALARARQFDAIVAHHTTYPHLVDAMHDANPALKLAAYTNGMHTQNDHLPEDWYAHDRNGKRVKDGGVWFANYLMDPLSGWVDHEVLVCQNMMGSSGYDTLYIDGAGMGALGVADPTHPPIDRRTGKPWTPDRWLSQMLRFYQTMDAKVDAPQWCNGVGDAKRYYDVGTSVVADEVERTFSEQFLRYSDDNIASRPSPHDFYRTSTMLAEMGRKFSGITKLWTPGSSDAKDRWHRFALASYLVLTEPGAMFYLTYHRAGALPTPFHPWWGFAKSLGARRTGCDVLRSGVYTRGYRNGRAYVNPTDRHAKLTFHERVETAGGVIHRKGSATFLPPGAGLIVRSA